MPASTAQGREYHPPPLLLVTRLLCLRGRDSNWPPGASDQGLFPSIGLGLNARVFNKSQIYGTTVLGV
jgi:hypothetical protein